jgi:hypothetical protein
VGKQNQVGAGSLEYYSTTKPPPAHPGCPYRRAERLRQTWLWSISIGVTLLVLAIIVGSILFTVSVIKKDDPRVPRNVQPLRLIPS